MSGSAAASTEEFIELLSAEQYVDLPKLRDYARHGVQPAVRGEVWLYLLGVLSDDKSQEMTSVRSKYIEYDSLDKHSDLYEKRIRNEAARYYQRRLIPRAPPGRKSGRPFHRITLRGAHLPSSHHDDGHIKEEGHAQAPGSGVQSEAIDNLTNNRATSSMARGPNRVDNGQQRVLAGIMGGSLSLGIPANSTQNGTDDKVLLDPEAASANEMKRFCLAVEDIICAHLNRWKWRTLGGASGLWPVAQTPSASKEDGDNAADLAAAHGEASGSKGAQPDTIVSVAQSLSTLPKEYEWAHEPADIPRGINAGAFSASGSKNGKTADSASGSEDQQIYKPEYHPDLIVLCAPFVMCIRSEAGMYFAFERLMALVEQYNVQHPLPARIATFLTLFRTTLPELYAYFDEEEVDVIGLASAWLRHLLAAEMRIENLMRLWDTYFAVPDPLDLHMYVCLAILTNCKDALEELDQSEAKSMLFSLPPLDVDRIINEAINIRLAHRQSELIGTKEDENVEGEEGSDGDGEDVAENSVNEGGDVEAEGPVDILEKSVNAANESQDGAIPNPTQT